MAAIPQLLLSVFLLSFIGQGISQSSKCSIQDISIEQEKTGQLVQSKPEFKVTFFNACPCLQNDLTVFCDGFDTVEPVSQSSLAKTSKGCLLNTGTLGPFGGTFFNYAWDSEFPFKVISSTISC